MNELAELKQDVKEMKGDQKDMIKAINDLRVLVAGKYAEKKSVNQLWLAVIGSYVAIIGFLYYITTLINGQFAQHIDQFQHVAK